MTAVPVSMSVAHGKPLASLLLPLEPLVQERRTATAFAGDVSPQHQPPLMQQRKQLRKEMRATRRRLSAADQAAHARDVARRLRGFLPFQSSSRIAFYLSNDGEINLLRLMQHALREKKKSFLPVLRRQQNPHLWFVEYRPGERLLNNRFGISEPRLQLRSQTPPWGLDAILLPLVAFDEHGNRLGMGGGFYDRTLAYKRRRLVWRPPLLIGVAHECQKVPLLPKQPWDVPLDFVVTEAKLYVMGCRAR